MASSITTTRPGRAARILQPLRGESHHLATVLAIEGCLLRLHLPLQVHLGAPTAVHVLIEVIARTSGWLSSRRAP
jgi:hypothetical protein